MRAHRPRLHHLGLLLLCLVALPCLAQSTEGDILARLRGQPLFLKGLWGANRLAFDHLGKPLASYGQVSFTLAAIDVYRVKLRDDGLEIEGQRMGIEFEKAFAPHRVALDWPGYPGQIHIVIAGTRGDDFSAALDEVFAPNLRSLVPSLPVVWERVGRQLLGAAEPARAPTASSTPRPQHVSPPALLKQAPPRFSAAAEGLGYRASVGIYLWVDAAGKPDHLRITRPAGLGLDEEALASASAYVFRPALADGVPVKVDLYVNVDFGFASN